MHVGFYRSIPTVNGQVPGPSIEVDEGDVVVVHLQNKLENAATTIHWHGMYAAVVSFFVFECICLHGINLFENLQCLRYQRGTPWMDGVSAITQCAVLPGQVMLSNFELATQC